MQKKISRCLLIIIGLGIVCFLPQEVAAQVEEYISPETLLFQEIPVVTIATKTAQPITVAPASISVITGEEIKNSGARALSDLAGLIPGVYIVTSDRGTENPWIRGVRNRRNNLTAMLVDGIPLRSLMLGWHPIDEELLLDDVKKVEVMKGPSSALYGTGAFSGVFGVFTKDGGDIDGWETSGGLGDKDTERFHLSYGKKFENWEPTFSISHYKTEGQGPELNQYGNPQVQKRDPIDSNRARLKIKFDNGLYLIGYHSEFGHTNLIGTDWPDPDSWYDYDTNSLALGYDSFLTEDLFFQGKIYMNDFHDKTRYKYWYPSTVVMYHNWSDHWETVIGTDLQLTFDHFKEANHEIIAGFGYEQEKIKSKGYRCYDVAYGAYSAGDVITYSEVPKSSKGNWALYLQDSWEFSKQVILTTGLRYDNYEQFGGTINPRVGVVVLPTDELILKFLYGTAFKAPEYRQSAYISQGYILGNPDLKPETIKTSEIIAEYSPWKDLKLQLNTFYSIHKDIIAAHPTLYVYENRPGAERVWGTEGEIKKLFLDGKLTSFVNFSYVNTHDPSTGLKLHDVPIQMTNLGFNWKPIEMVNFNVNIQGVGRRPRISPDPVPSSSYYANVRSSYRGALKSYHVVNTTLRLENIFKSMDVSASIFNLFDKEYYTSVYEVEKYLDIQCPGRLFLVSLSAEF
ncbi:MAG: TonB-dependent receptor [Candidatus Omnitrophota bacterium]